LQLYVNIERLLLEAAKGQVTDEQLSCFLGEDIDQKRVHTQLLHASRALKTSVSHKDWGTEVSAC